MDIDGEGRIYQNGTNYQYDYYLKDHLGSTRMVINDQNQITEAIAYQPYGTIVPMEDIATSPQTPTRQQFIGKEFDQEGSGVGIRGMELYYFGKRYYDPELGVFLTPDPEDQYWSPYTYCGGDPINQIDPDGAFAAGIGVLQFSQTTQQLMSTAALLESGALAMQSVALGQAVSQIFQMAAQPIFGALNAVQQTINKISLIGTIWTIAQIANISNNIQNVISNAAQMSSQGGQQAAQSGSMSNMGGAQGGDPNNYNFDKNGKVQSKGTQVNSKTLWKSEKGRIDVENPNPQQRPGQIHFQDKAGNEWIYDPKTNQFPNAPNWVNKLLDDPKFINGIEKGLKYLGGI